MAQFDDLVNPLDQASIEFKVVHDSLVSQGFSRREALYLLAAQITSSPGMPPSEETAYNPPD